MIRTDTESLLQLDNEFDRLLHAGNSAIEINKALGNMVLVLNKITGKTIQLQLVEKSVDQIFNMMSVYPSDNILTAVVMSMINQESDIKIVQIWNSAREWSIEIDSRLLSGEPIAFTNRELTAMLLHECGHVMDSNTIPANMARVMKFELAKMSIGMNAISKNGLFTKLLQVPIVKACSLKKRSRDDLNKELRADLYARKLGYGNDLQSAFIKILEYDDEMSKMSAANEMAQDTLFTLETIDVIRRRESKLSRFNLINLVANVPEGFANRIKLIIGATGFKNSKYESVETVALDASLLEAVNSIYESAYMKEAFDMFKKKMKRIDPSIVDYVLVRKDSIKSNDDKLMLVQYIYSKIDLIEYYLQIMDDPKLGRKYLFANSKNELIRMRSDLINARKQILEYKVPITQYGININYPDGYYG